MQEAVGSARCPPATAIFALTENTTTMRSRRVGKVVPGQPIPEEIMTKSSNFDEGTTVTIDRDARTFEIKLALELST